MTFDVENHRVRASKVITADVKISIEYYYFTTNK